MAAVDYVVPPQAILCLRFCDPFQGPQQGCSTPIAGGHLSLVGCKGSQHFTLLMHRHFEVIERASEFRCNLIEFGGRNTQVAMGFFKPKRRAAGPRGRELERST